MSHWKKCSKLILAGGLLYVAGAITKTVVLEIQEKYRDLKVQLASLDQPLAEPTTSSKLEQILRQSSLENDPSYFRPTNYSSQIDLSTAENNAEKQWLKGKKYLEEHFWKNPTLNYPAEVQDQRNLDGKLGDDCYTQCIYVETTDENYLSFAKIDVPAGTKFPVRVCQDNSNPNTCIVAVYTLDQTILILREDDNDENGTLVVREDGLQLTKFNQTGKTEQDYVTQMDDNLKKWQEIDEP